MMTLPDYKNSLEYWTEMDKRYSCGLLYGFHYYNNQIIPAFIKKLAIYKYELYKSINVSNQSISFLISPINQITISSLKTFYIN
jgi:hypothetical protein